MSRQWLTLEGVLLGAIALLTGLVAASPAAGAATVGDLLSAYDNGTPMQQQFTEEGISGIEQGILYANAYLIVVKQPRIYCPPMQGTLTSAQLIQILRDNVKRDPGIATLTPGAAVLSTLQAAYPCSKDEK